MLYSFNINSFTEKYDPQETDESLESKFTTVWQASLKQEEG